MKVEDVFLRYLMKKPPLRRITIFDDYIDVGTALIYGFFLQKEGSVQRAARDKISDSDLEVSPFSL